jgi:DNA-binding NarL/FixJ family response regulator
MEMPQEAIRVIIVEPEALYRRGLVGCLQADPRFAVVGSAASVADGYQLAADASPDVALVGTPLATPADHAVVTELRRRARAVAVIVVTAGASDDQRDAAIRAGAAASVAREIGEDDLYALIARVAHGAYLINPLTARELEILCSISDGMTNAQIGEALGISAHTVKSHNTAILHKLAVTGRTQAVMIALKWGWLPIETAAVDNG